MLPPPNQVNNHLRGILQVSRSEEHTSELQSHSDLVCRLLLEKKIKNELMTMTLIKKIKCVVMDYEQPARDIIVKHFLLVDSLQLSVSLYYVITESSFSPWATV